MARHRLEISIIEAFLVFAILSAWFSFLAPAVNQARYKDGHPPILDGFTPFAADNGWSVTRQLLFIPVSSITTGSIVVVLLVTGRALLPHQLRQPIVWLSATSPLSSATKSDWIRGTVAVVFLITVLFLSIIFFPR